MSWVPTASPPGTLAETVATMCRRPSTAPAGFVTAIVTCAPPGPATTWREVGLAWVILKLPPTWSVRVSWTVSRNHSGSGAPWARWRILDMPLLLDVVADQGHADDEAARVAGAQAEVGRRDARDEVHDPREGRQRARGDEHDHRVARLELRPRRRAEGLGDEVRPVGAARGPELADARGHEG